MGRGAQQSPSSWLFSSKMHAPRVLGSLGLRLPQATPINGCLCRPERFLKGSAEMEARNPHAYLPFGVGPRKCIGYK